MFRDLDSVSGPIEGLEFLPASAVEEPKDERRCYFPCLCLRIRIRVSRVHGQIVVRYPNFLTWRHHMLGETATVSFFMMEQLRTGQVEIAIMIAIRARPRYVSGYQRRDDGVKIVRTVGTECVFAGDEVAVEDCKIRGFKCEDGGENTSGL